jgi:hypothetical protein
MHIKWPLRLYGANPNRPMEVKMAKNRLFNLVIALALIAVVLLTFREATATSSILWQVTPLSISHSSIEAMAVRWEAMAKHFFEMQPQEKAPARENSPRSQRSIEAEVARWNAMAENASR